MIIKLIMHACFLAFLLSIFTQLVAVTESDEIIEFVETANP